MEKKYKFTDKTMELEGHILYQIRALRSFSGISEGSFGGFIESEANLSHTGRCWLHDDACVYDDAGIYEDTWIFGNSIICEAAKVCGNTLVSDHHIISGNAIVCGTAHVHGNVKLNSSIWNKTVKINNKNYLISTTLEKLLLE